MGIAAASNYDRNCLQVYAKSEPHIYGVLSISGYNEVKTATQENNIKIKTTQTRARPANLPIINIAKSSTAHENPWTRTFWPHAHTNTYPALKSGVWFRWEEMVCVCGLFIEFRVGDDFAHEHPSHNSESLSFR